MELKYVITEQDYIDFNLNFWRTNVRVQRMLLQLRIVTTLLCLVAGTALMLWLKLSPLTIVAYAALAAVIFFGLPSFMQRKVKKNVLKILRNAKNKNLCGEMCMTLGDSGFRLVGAGEDSGYLYENVHRVASDEAHYYVYVDEYSSLIIPFTAFADEQQKQAFYDRMTSEITDEAFKQ